MILLAVILFRLFSPGLIVERAKVGGGRAGTAIGLRKFAHRQREVDRGLAPPSFRLGQSFLRLRSLNRLGSFAGEQGDVDIFEDLARSDAKNTIGGLDQIVALASGVLTAKDVGEGEAGGELFCFDQKTGAVGDPWIRCFHECWPVLSFDDEE